MEAAMIRATLEFIAISAFLFMVFVVCVGLS